MGDGIVDQIDRLLRGLSGQIRAKRSQFRDQFPCRTRFERDGGIADEGCILRQRRDLFTQRKNDLFVFGRIEQQQGIAGWEFFCNLRRPNDGVGDFRLALKEPGADEKGGKQGGQDDAVP